jgi:hypothetical protein
MIDLRQEQANAFDSRRVNSESLSNEIHESHCNLKSILTKEPEHVGE